MYPFFYFPLTNTLLLISCPSPAAVKTSSTTVSGTSPWAKWPSRAPRRLSHLPSLKSPMKSWTPWRSRSHTSAARFRERRYRRCALIQISACRYSEVDASWSWICAVVSPISVWKLKQDYFFFVFFLYLKQSKCSSYYFSHSWIVLDALPNKVKYFHHQRANKGSKVIDRLRKKLSEQESLLLLTSPSIPLRFYNKNGKVMVLSILNYLCFYFINSSFPSASPHCSFSSF